jgi:hypothetical protein
MSVLHSWKEISQYMGRGIRTAQRWEEEFGLPIRRAEDKERGTVFALSGEIDEWFRSRPMLNGDKELYRSNAPEDFRKLRSRSSEILSVSESNLVLMRQIRAKIITAIEKMEKRRTTTTKALGILFTWCGYLLSDCFLTSEYLQM